MNNQIISEDEIDKLRGNNKNCIIVMGGEPVVTNHTISLCQNYFKKKDFGIEVMIINSTTKSNDLIPILSDGSLFNNNILYKILVSRGRIAEEVKQLITQSLINNQMIFILLMLKQTLKTSKNLLGINLYKNLALLWKLMNQTQQK